MTTMVAQKKVQLRIQKGKVESSVKQHVEGPSYFEVEFLRQIKEELEIFLHSKNFSTIQKFEIGFAGSGYHGSMVVQTQ